MSVDTQNHPERPKMTTNNTTVPPEMIPIPLRQSYDLGHTQKPTRINQTSLNGLKSSKRCRGGSRIATILNE